MSDSYYARLLSIARQNKNIKFIKNIKDNNIEVEFNDGRAEWLPWEDVMSFKRILESTEKQK